MTLQILLRKLEKYLTFFRTESFDKYLTLRVRNKWEKNKIKNQILSSIKMAMYTQRLVPGTTATKFSTSIYQNLNYFLSL